MAWSMEPIRDLFRPVPSDAQPAEDLTGADWRRLAGWLATRLAVATVVAVAAGVAPYAIAIGAMAVIG